MKFNVWLVAMAASLAGCGNSSQGAAAAADAPDAPTLTMGSPRAAHGAVALPDGRILLIGGCVLPSCEGGPASATAEAFDPGAGGFVPAGNLSGRRVSASVAAIADGRVLIAGGWAGAEVTGAVELFDPAAGRSRAVGALSAPRADMAVATMRDGRILLAGGYDGSRASDAVDIFDPADLSVRRAGSLLAPRAGGGAGLLPDGRVLIAGGGANGEGGLRPTGSAEIFDPATGRSTATGPLAHPRYKHALVALRDGALLVVGGSDGRDAGGKLRAVERYDPVKGAFAAAGETIAARYKIGGALVALADGRVLIAGGAARAELFDPATGGSVTVGPSFGGALNFATATALADGRILVAGGYYEDGIRMSRRAWLLTPPG